MKVVLILYLCVFSSVGKAQDYVIKDIKSFGAKGDGKADDHIAFEKAAAFFNQRGGNGKLIISKGVYIIGKQNFTQGKDGKPAYQGLDVLHLAGVKNMIVEGSRGSKLKYKNGLRYGAFNPKSGAAHEHGNNYFVQGEWAAIIGNCIKVTDAKSVTIKNLELDGNSEKLVLGGVYGDVGIQLPHNGIFIQNSKSVTLDGIYVHHFGLDGAMVANEASTVADEIKLLDCVFTYNGRQGLSWIGGNDLKAKGCKFNHTGQGKFSSAPGAGVDIEAEVGPIRNGKFEDCEFINNKGCGMVADTGDSGFCEFKECTFWGLEAWSAWVTKPGFTFSDCEFFGSFVHGYDAANDRDATKFINTHFEDRPYNNKEPYGNFLVESNGMRRMTFVTCTFVSHKKKIVWFESAQGLKPEEKYQFRDCRFTMNNNNLPQGDFVGLIRGITYKNCTFEFNSKEAKKNGYYVSDCCNQPNTDGGGNKVVYAQ